MGCCISKHSVEKQVVYEPLYHKPYGLSYISEVSQETEETKELEPLHI